ncbi:MAG: Methylated-DNA--protein-cysteine methyltransferase [uncultured Thermomicrobiales bacterium]|uniref:Methylated-DNA--protein-cysteine methyltransferase n=1 Tax=uncultured Thermomicrobiales bacterium TaxID=1645740 RepID=A0A6J4V3W5_9BACT|nr:MAG: Methylated-DNA--protein-cysteine methyltransferase [uncultured Thermomicrobiales bacterium]
MTPTADQRTAVHQGAPIAGGSVPGPVPRPPEATDVVAGAGDGEVANRPSASWPGSTLARAAASPGTDPCDVACDAMPAHVDRDLPPVDAAWLLDHTTDCGYCDRMLTSYLRVGDVLGCLCAPVPDVPPPFRPPISSRRPRATATVAPVRATARWAEIPSPVGVLRVAATDAGVCEVGFAANEPEPVFLARLRNRGLDPRPDPAIADAGTEASPAGRAIDQLREYFAGGRDRFEVPVDLSGVTPFTRAVLDATADIPFGHLATYGQIAARIGSPGGSRAVGNALGRNPVPVIVPCHRVVRSGHALGGYTGGSWIKERLLAIEGVTLPGM